MTVTIYVLPDCGHCSAAKAYLRRKGIEYRELNVMTDREGAEKKEKWIEEGKELIFPIIDFNGKLIEGFEKLKEELDGYTK